MSMFAHVPLSPPDAIFGVKDAFVKDPSPNKINLSIGAFRDDDGKPVVLPTIREAERRIVERGDNMEYCPITGFAEYKALTLCLAYGPESPAIDDGRIAVTAALSGTGALRVIGEFIARFPPHAPGGMPSIYLPNPTWGNHKGVFRDAGLEVLSYRYYEPATCGLDLDGMLDDLKAMPAGSAVLLHTCAHNPTGVDPSHDQWRTLSKVIAAKRLFPIFDNAYQGFATGDADADAFALRLFASEGHQMACCQSYAKNMGLYGQRAGALSVVCSTGEEAARVQSHLSRIVRTLWSSPPIQGQRLVMEVLRDAELRRLWRAEMKMMSSRISDMRTVLRKELLALGSKDPRDWRHLIDQVGMFCFTGLTPDQVNVMTSKHHIYMLGNGRISMAGVTTKNVGYLARAIHDVTK